MTFGDWLADKIFCTECFRLRISPGHWLTRFLHSPPYKPDRSRDHEWMTPMNVPWKHDRSS